MLTILSCTGFSAGANTAQRIYELWDPAPAPNRGDDPWVITHRGYGYDKDWEEWSYPIGNGYMGANVFGRVDTERVQITEKTLHNLGVYDRGGLTGFANIFLDFNHENIGGYHRSLNLNDAIAHVDYQAAGKTLDFRGNNTTGWALAHRMNARARLKESEKAHEVYDKFISERTVPNLWALHPPFQIDGSLGCMAGVTEMLLQSHEGFIELLPALPKAWSEKGFFEGLVARGNFVVSAKWENGKATAFTITSRAGGECRVRYPGIETAVIKTEDRQPVEILSAKAGQIRFSSTKGETYRMILTKEKGSFLRHIWPW